MTSQSRTHKFTISEQAKAQRQSKNRYIVDDYRYLLTYGNQVDVTVSSSCFETITTSAKVHMASSRVIGYPKGSRPDWWEQWWSGSWRTNLCKRLPASRPQNMSQTQHANAHRWYRQLHCGVY